MSNKNIDNSTSNYNIRDNFIKHGHFKYKGSPLITGINKPYYSSGILQVKYGHIYLTLINNEDISDVAKNNSLHFMCRNNIHDKTYLRLIAFEHNPIIYGPITGIMNDNTNIEVKDIDCESLNTNIHIEDFKNDIIAQCKTTYLVHRLQFKNSKSVSDLKYEATIKHILNYKKGNSKKYFLIYIDGLSYWAFYDNEKLKNIVNSKGHYIRDVCNQKFQNRKYDIRFVFYKEFNKYIASIVLITDENDINELLNEPNSRNILDIAIRFSRLLKLFINSPVSITHIEYIYDNKLSNYIYNTYLSYLPKLSLMNKFPLYKFNSWDKLNKIIYRFINQSKQLSQISNTFFELHRPKFNEKALALANLMSYMSGIGSYYSQVNYPNQLTRNQIKKSNLLKGLAGKLYYNFFSSIPNEVKEKILSCTHGKRLKHISQLIANTRNEFVHPSANGRSTLKNVSRMDYKLHWLIYYFILVNIGIDSKDAVRFIKYTIVGRYSF